MALIDADLLFLTKDDAKARFSKVATAVKDSFRTYPATTTDTLQVLHCTREGRGVGSVFHLNALRWKQPVGWTAEELEMPPPSRILAFLGSGGAGVEEWYQEWEKATGERTSRSAFGAFRDSLEAQADPYTGGAPQLVGLYRVGAAKTFGVFYQEQRYILGLPVPASDSLAAVMWWNTLFERCDWRTGKPLRGAQRQPRPKGVKLRAYR